MTVKSSHVEWNANFVFRLVPAFILIVSSVLKVDELMSSPYGHIFGSRVLTVLIAEYDLLLGFWLISEFRPSLSKIVTVLTFAIYAHLNSWFWIAGSESCQCFGRIGLSPIHSLFLNLICIYSLVSWKTPQQPPLRVWPIITFVIIAVAISFLSRFESSELSVSGKIIGNGKAVILEPTDWIGEPFALANHFSRKNEQILQGERRVLLYSSECLVCTEIIEDLLTSGPKFQTHLVNISPKSNDWLVKRTKSNHRVDHNTLDANREWFASVPTWIILKDGSVVDVQPGK